MGNIAGSDFSYSYRKTHLFGFCAVLLTYFLTQQIILRDYNLLMNLVVLLATLFLAIKKTARVTVIFLFFMLLNFLIGAVIWGDVINSFRFFVIVIATILAFQVKEKSPPLKIILGVGGIQAVVVISIGFYLMMVGDAIFANDLRSFVLINNLGDIYSFDGVYYRVQLVGNALIPFLFMVSYQNRAKSFFYKFFSILYFLAIIFCGNLTFFIVIFIYIFIELDRFEKMFFATCCACISPFLMAHLYEIISMKFDGGASSMGIRFDQICAIENRFSENPLTFITGWGFGARIPDGVFNNYSSSLYIELQSLFIFFQIGLFGSLLYIANVIYYVRKVLSRGNALIFFMYLVYSSTNPYMFDTTHFLVVLLLTMLSNADRGRGISLQPLRLV